MGSRGRLSRGGNQSVSVLDANSMPLPTNQVESTTQPRPYSVIPLKDFRKVTARTEESIAFADDSWSTKEDEESTIYVKLAV